ncbi:hypothetical protein WA026_008702 [Henosepilachna vigintioctopunctata]|uniref:Uncharacterized protein n=1 Tax=Henosepilachna vigintioctopunctata TaxID=420089 RepID=A0AAW1V5G0_9CUCU
MNSLKAKKSSPEMGQKNGSMSLETKKDRARDPDCPPPPYALPPRRSKKVRSLPPLSLPVSIPVTQLTKSFRSRLNIKQRQLPSGVKPSELSPMKATHKIGDSCESNSPLSGNSCESNSPLSDSNGQDVSTKATDNAKKNN